MTRKNQILLLLTLLVIAIPTIFIYDYTQNNPKFCTTCHLMNEAYDTWQTSAMHDLNCHNCHETDMITSLNHLYEVLVKKPQNVTKPIEIDNEVCVECHKSEDPQFPQISNTTGHKVHIYGNGDDTECIECHGISLHVFQPPEEACFKCHEPEKIHVSETMRADCLDCHQFLVEEEDLIPQRANCLDCHEEKELVTISMPADAHLNSTCTTCHNPHGQVTDIDCMECHTVDEGLHDISQHTNCTSCHVPHKTPTIRETCESCHIDKVDHYTPVHCTKCHN